VKVTIIGLHVSRALMFSPEVVTKATILAAVQERIEALYISKIDVTVDTADVSYNQEHKTIITGCHIDVILED
jgi:hypothetical protein